VFEHFNAAYRQLEAMNLKLDNKTFDADDHVPRQVSRNRFEILMGGWKTEKQSQKFVEEKEILGGWLRSYEKAVNKQHRTKVHFRKITQRVRDYLLPFFKGMDIRDIKKRQVREFYDHLCDHPNDLADKTIKDILSVLHSFLSEYDDIISNVPKFPAFKVIPRRKKKWMDRSTQLHVLSFIPNMVDHLACEVLVDTKIRQGELRGLKKRDMVFQKYSLVISRVFSENEFREITKDGHHCYNPKFVDMSKAVWRKLERHAELLDLNDLLFTRDGLPYSKDRLNNTVWKSACKAAGIEFVPLTNATRHSGASQAVADAVAKAREEAEQTASEQLGHSEKGTTKRHYIMDESHRIKR
jgi:integrase